MPKDYQRGVSIYLAVALMAVILSIALGAGAILVGQVKTIGSMGRSVAAFYAADAGIERAVYAIRKGSPAYSPGTSSRLCGAGNYFGDTCRLDNGAAYEIEDNSAPDCGGAGVDVCIKSKGEYKKAVRTMEINW